MPAVVQTPASPLRRRADRRLATALTTWFNRSGRDLPWRTRHRDPYHALVAEAMLQQTQVSRVVAYFERFVARFPTLADLAAADEHQVLALWSGLGYYRRARHLHRAAQAIMVRFGGRVPAPAHDLRTLPGIGPYTAGAIASIVFGRSEPLVDGNVQRVLLRLEGRRLDPSAPATVRWAWERAGELVAGATDPGAFNEGLMELGATVCLPAPASPACGVCPLRRRCKARARGLQASIPRPKPKRPPRVLRVVSVVVCDARGRVLLERRPTEHSRGHSAAGLAGLWAGLWQPPTTQRSSGAAAEVVAASLLASCGLTPTRSTRHAGRVVHLTTHRRVVFDVFAAHVRGRPAPRGCVWEDPAALGDRAIASAALKVLARAGVTAAASGPPARATRAQMPPR